MSASLVGSEMCIRDSRPARQLPRLPLDWRGPHRHRPAAGGGGNLRARPVSYTHLTLPTICSV
eukprot:8255716-Alexandrium_andersonii.AAC.1